MAERDDGLGDDALYIAFPAAGGTRTVGAGDLVLDFGEGIARLPDGTDEPLSGKLKGTPFRVVHATVNASQRVEVDHDGRGFWTVSANQQVTFLWIPCRILTVRATQSTNVRVLGATDPRGGPATADVTAPTPL